MSAEDLPPHRQFIILPERLTVAQTEALVARCKKEGVSVHAAVCVAWLRALIEKTGRDSGVGMVSSPVNLRERLAFPVGETSGLFLSLVETSVDCGPENDFWDVARAFKQKLGDDLCDEILFFRLLLFSKIFAKISPSDRQITAKLLFSSPIEYDFSITNLGRIPISEHNGAFQVEAFYGPLVNSSKYERTVGVSTAGGRMSLSLIFRKSMMEPARGKALIGRALEILTEAAA